MEPQRILHVLGALDRGGAETMVMNLYRHIDRSKLQFDFVIHIEKKCDYTDEILSLGGRIYSMPQYNGINTVQYIKAWNSFFKKHTEYKIVHGHMRSTASIYLMVAKKYGIYTVAHSHNTSSGRGISAIAKNLYQYPIRYIADYFFACSETAGKWLFGDKIIQSDRFEVINNAIDADSYRFNPINRASLRESMGLKNKFVIGHIGRFHEQKNHEFLVDVYKEIKKKYPESVLLLIGEGELKQNIKEKVCKLGLEASIYFLGMREDVNDILQAVDLFLFPSIYEGLGIVAIEAEASGIPVICSDRVPYDVQLTENVEFVELNIDKWLEAVERYRYFEDRKDTYEAIKNSGYDIHTTAVKMEEFYLRRYQSEEI